jgi:hypothetical protein
MNRRSFFRSALGLAALAAMPVANLLAKIPRAKVAAIHYKFKDVKTVWRVCGRVDASPWLNSTMPVSPFVKL